MGVIVLSLCGMTLGAFYDFSKAVRRKFAYNTVASVICDFLFCVFALLTVSKTLYVRYALELRFHRIFGILCGFAIYFLLFSPCFLKFFDIFLDFFEKILKILFTIVCFCAKILKRCMRFIFSPLMWCKKRIKRIFFKIRSKILRQIKFIKRKW